jgi:hypothetical protein
MKGREGKRKGPGEAKVSCNRGKRVRESEKIRDGNLEEAEG